MAAQPNALPALLKDQAPQERRREPRFGAEGEVTVIVVDGPHERELKAKLLDFSLHGLRVRVPDAVPEGAEVRVFFSWGEVTTIVARSAEATDGYDLGLQLF